MIGERDVFQPAGGDVLVEGGPAAVLALEREEPSQGAGRLLSPLRGVGGCHVPQRHEHHHGIVGVRIIFVLVLEGPTAGFNARDVHSPVALEAHFLFLQPRGGLLQSRMILRQAGFGEGDGGDGGVPDGRKAGLDAKILRVIHKEAGKVAVGFFHERVIVRVTESAQGHHGIEHGREDGAEAFAPLAHSLDHPGFGGLQRPPAERVNGELVVELQEFVAPEKKVPPSPEARVLFEREVGIFESCRIELVELHGRGEMAHGLVVIENRQRRDDRPAPRRHLVEVEEKPIREEEDLRRDGGQVLPRKLAEKRKVKLSVGVDLRDAAEAEDVRAGLPHPRGVGRVAGKLEREVCLNRGVDFARTTDKNIPAAVGELAATNVSRAFGLQGFIHLPQPMHVDDIVATEGGIGDELAFPMAVGSLQAKEISLSAANAFLDGERRR